MDSQHMPESQPSNTFSPLLALPLELKLQILSNFSEEDADPENAITLMVLRRTHKSLRQIIPNPWNKSSPDYDHFHAPERQHPYLFPWECRCSEPACRSDRCSTPRFLFYPCYRCVKLLSREDNFDNYQIARYRLKNEAIGLGGEGLSEVMGGEHGGDRICDDCWMEILDGIKSGSSALC